MKKTILIALISAFFSAPTAAEEYSAIRQLGLQIPPSADISEALPEAGLSYPGENDKGDVTSQFERWDPDAPFLYCLKPSEVTYRPGAAVIKNMRWGAIPDDKKTYTWETASVKPGLLKKVFLGYKTAGVGHMFLIFVFEEGGLVNSRGETAAAFSAGAEGWSREPHGYSVFHATAGRYPLLWNVDTLTNYLEYTAGLKEANVFITPVAIDRDQALALLGKTLERINETNARKEIYGSFSNNCTTNPVDLLNSVLPSAKRIDKTSFLGLANPGHTFPRFAVGKYTKLGVISPSPLKIDKTNYASFDISAY